MQGEMLKKAMWVASKGLFLLLLLFLAEPKCYNAFQQQ